MSLEGFRQAYVLNGGNATFGEQQTQGLAAGQVTQYFSLTPRGGKGSVLGAFFAFVGTATATGASTPTAGTDQLDPFIGLGGTITVAAAAGGAQRGQTLTRQFAEFVWAVTSNYPFSIAANTTFASAGTSAYSVTLFLPIGTTTGGAAVVQFQLPGAITGVWGTNVTFAYTSITSYIVSADFDGIVAFNEELTASLGSGLQTVTNYVPQTISPDAIFMKGESSATITQAYVQTITGYVLLTSVNTALTELGAGGIAAIAGTTYTTTAGFVIAGNQQAFAIFQLTFASATTHYIGYLQIAGGPATAPQPTPAPTAAPAATTQVGAVTPSGQVTWAGPGGRPAIPGGGQTAFAGGYAGGAPGGGPVSLTQGTRGAIISRRT